ncbi:MAG: formyltransferase family protein, partial [Pseudomonadota bacterium]
MHSRKKIVILISGNGSNAQAIIEACNENKIHGDVVAVISNKANAYGLIRAKSFSIPAQTIEHSKYDSRAAFDNAMMDLVDSYAPDLIVLAGFMRILTPNFVGKYLGKMLNI